MPPLYLVKFGLVLIQLSSAETDDSDVLGNRHKKHTQGQGRHTLLAVIDIRLQGGDVEQWLLPCLFQRLPLCEQETSGGCGKRSYINKHKPNALKELQIKYKYNKYVYFLIGFFFFLRLI